MSSSVRDAYTKRTSVASRGLDRISSSSWYIGVMPVPPATMASDAHWLALYANLMYGPFTSTVSPTFSSVMALRKDCV